MANTSSKTNDTSILDELYFEIPLSKDCAFYRTDNWEHRDFKYDGDLPEQRYTYTGNQPTVPTHATTLMGASYYFDDLVDIWAIENRESNRPSLIVQSGGVERDYQFPEVKHYAYRPAVGVKSEEALSLFEKTDKVTEDGKPIYHFGRYPQDVPDKEVCDRIKEEKKQGKLHATKNSYTLAGKQYKEYESSDGRRWVFMKGKFNKHNTQGDAPNKVKNGEIYPVEVLPIEWIQLYDTGFIARKALFSGVPFHNSSTFNSPWESDVYDFLEEVFAKDLAQSMTMERTQEKTFGSFLKKAYNFLTGGSSKEPQVEKTAEPKADTPVAQVESVEKQTTPRVTDKANGDELRQAIAGQKEQPKVAQGQAKSAHSTVPPRNPNDNNGR